MKIYERHKVQMDKNRIKEIEYMLSLGIATTSISRYFGYDKRVTSDYIKQNIIKDVRLKQHLRLTNNEIDMVLKFKLLLGKEILSTYDIRKRYNQNHIELLYKCVEIWNYPILKTKPIIKPQHYKMIEIGWYIDLYETNDSEKETIDYFIARNYDVWGLCNCGCDFIVRKDGVYTLVETKTTLTMNNGSSAIVQLLFAKDIVKNGFGIDVNNNMICFTNIKKDINMSYLGRYLKHFNVEPINIRIE